MPPAENYRGWKLYDEPLALAPGRYWVGAWRLGYRPSQQVEVVLEPLSAAATSDYAGRGVLE